ncbi:hypothetical protein [uncultured Maribacter sp.]|uniref:hypothetical protein n=1 Tax=uncultured Maribacter sp. TaxID=431308 RepID=UPI00260EC34B|nr:hypothetical protein [uncultured Maribacter sp.]
MKHKTIRGYIRYTSKKPERLNAERGREFFTITKQYDEKIVVQAHCEIDDEPNVVRDVVIAMDEKGAPLDCSVRLSVGDELEGTGWYWFKEDSVELEVFNKEKGRISERIPVKQPVKWLQAHPIVADALLMKLYDLTKGKGVQYFKDLLLTSPDHRGATGPMIFTLESIGLEYHGEEVITIKAGIFNARHFSLASADGLEEEHPAYNVWVTANEDYLFLKAGVEGYMQTHYELEELEYFE